MLFIFQISCPSPVAFKKQLGLGDRQLVQLFKTLWVYQTESVNAPLQNLHALIQTLWSISAPLANDLESKPPQIPTERKLPG